MNLKRLAAEILFGKRWFRKSKYPTSSSAALEKSRVRQALENARMGDTRALSALHREMRATSSRLSSHIRKVELALQQSPLEVSQWPPSKPGGTRDALSDTIAADCREQLTQPDLDFGEVIAHTLWCLLCGHGGFEMSIEDGRIASLTQVPPERYWWENGVMFVQPGDDPTERQPVEELGGAAPTLVVSPSTIERDLVGVLRACITPWMTARWGLEWWSSAVERGGEPFRYAAYQPSDDPADLLEKLRLMGSGGVGVFPAGVDLKFLENASTFAARPHQELVEHCDKDQAMAILGGTQTADIQKDAGSKASAAVHQNMFDLFVDGYGLAICGFVRRSILKPYVAFKYGEEAARTRTPMPVLKGKRYADLLSFFTAMEKAKSFGMETIPVAWVHAQTGIPMPEDGEAVVKGTAAPQPPPADPPDQEDPADVEDPEGLEDPKTVNQAAVRHAGAVDFETRCRRKAAGEILAPYRSLINQAAKEGATLSELYMRLIREGGIDATSPKLVDALAALQFEGFMEGYTAERDARWK